MKKYFKIESISWLEFENVIANQYSGEDNGYTAYINNRDNVNAIGFVTKDSKLEIYNYLEIKEENTVNKSLKEQIEEILNKKPKSTIAKILAYKNIKRILKEES